MLDQRQDDGRQDDGRRATSGARAPAPGGETLYVRTMPGGGYVRLELVPRDDAPGGGAGRLGRVVIEPRHPSPRRDDGPPLVVEEVAGEDEGAVVAELFRIARDNAAIARRVLRRRARAARAD